MKQVAVALVVIASLGSISLSCRNDGSTNQVFLESPKEREIRYYTCGMHPSVRVSPEDYEENRSKCPICNMDLVPVYAQTDEAEEMAPTVTISAHTARLAGVKTEAVVHRSLVKQILTVGEIVYDERRVAQVSARVGGRIEELKVDFVGRVVSRGEELASIYSPQLVSTQQEYLLALETLKAIRDSEVPEVVENAKSLVESTKRRMLLWGISEEEVERLRQEETPRLLMPIRSPIDGTVVEKSLVEGVYVEEGDHLYTVAELSTVWMLADIYEYETAWVRVGQEVELTPVAYPAEVFRGTIAFIDPILHAETRTVKVRADIPNPVLRLKPGMSVNVAVRVPVTGTSFPELAVGRVSEAGRTATYTCDCTGQTWTQSVDELKSCPYCGSAMPNCGTVAAVGEVDRTSEVLALPATSLLDTGKRKVVYVDTGDGHYEMREVSVGPRAGDYFPVIRGVEAGEEVVVKANFLIDSQTQLSGPAATMYDAAIPHSDEHQH